MQPSSLPRSGYGTGNGHPFENARDEFLSSLPPKYRVLYSPCASITDLQETIEKIERVVDYRTPKGRAFEVIKTLHDLLEPYFKVVDIFISSNPQYAALVWGALRLILQLASNFTNFFNELVSLLDALSNAFHQYELIFDLCSADPGLRKSSGIPNLLEAIYKDVLQIFHNIIKVFTKPDGKEKARLRHNAIVITKLLWKPFQSRFGDVLASLKSHRKKLFDEIHVLHFHQEAKERARQLAIANDIVFPDAEQAKKERELSQRERDLMATERQASSKSRDETQASLNSIRQILISIEKQRFDTNFDRIGKWLSPPIFTDSLDRARRLRQPETTTWIFEEPRYQDWLKNQLHRVEGPHKFGSNVLWVCGNPGAGKTVLASSIVDNLDRAFSTEGNRVRDVFYYFFEHKSTSNNSARSAYQSILAQVLSKHREDEEIMDKFSFMAYGSELNQGQNEASESILLDLLRLVLSDSSILILDGIDECQDSEHFVASLVKIWNTHSPSIILFSRVYVPALNQTIPQLNRLEITESKLSCDIRTYSNHELQRLFDEGLLPSGAQLQKDDLVEQMVTGANGMFLWARLMISFIQSPYITSRQRMLVLSKVSTPEGLEAMYDRIVNLILQAGDTCETLASKVLTLLTYATAPITSRQIYQAFVADNNPLFPKGPSPDPESIKEFEDSVIMACTGLIERTVLQQCPSFLHGESSLRLIHLSVYEVMTERYVKSSSKATISSFELVPDLMIASLDGTTNCLQQILFHTPAQPLSGHWPQRTYAESIYETFCFSDYASVCWLLHLQNFVDAVSTRKLIDGPWSRDFLRSIDQFLSSLEKFLACPRTLSVWLEIFYTTEYHEMDPQKYGHPSAHPLRALALWAKQTHAREIKSLLSEVFVENIEAFSTELSNAVVTWGGSLHEKPQIVWDELTAFLHHGRFFWSSGSTNVSYQGHTTPTQTPTALLSRTSVPGDMKAVLSIWSNPEFQNPTYKQGAWIEENQITDITGLCTGWTATYEIWKLRPENVLLAKIHLQLRAEELLIPMRGDLWYKTSTQIELPIAISPDLTSFTILETLFSATRTIGQLEYRCVSCPLPVRRPGAANFLWMRPLNFRALPEKYLTIFSESMNHLALLERQKSGKQRLTVCEYIRTDHLKINILNSMEFSEEVYTIRKALFHPKLPLLSFCAYGMWKGHFENGAYIWSYQREAAEFIGLPDSEVLDPVAYSGCDRYFIAKEHEANETGPPVIFPIPERYLQPPTAPLIHDASHDVRTSHEVSVSSPVSNSDKLGLIPSRIHGLNQAWNINSNGNVSNLQVQASAGEISLSSTTQSGTQRINLVDLPSCLGASGTTQRVFLPQFDGDSLKISIDVDIQSHFLHSSNRPSGARGNRQPSVIQRDPGFIAVSHSTIDSSDTHQSSQQLPYRGRDGKRRYPDAQDEEASSSTKRGRCM
ncbi:hypothetical protein F4810DRAFT_714926 [Camillea tinctor]|nr:hypothetical protein F4810DRAFT_714926 [Camillea tinctor]